MSTPENAPQSKTSVSQTEISEENIYHEQPAFNPFQKEMFTYLVEGFKVSTVSKLITWEMFIHRKGSINHLLAALPGTRKGVIGDTHTWSLVFSSQKTDLRNRIY